MSIHRSILAFVGFTATSCGPGAFGPPSIENFTVDGEACPGGMVSWSFRARNASAAFISVDGNLPRGTRNADQDSGTIRAPDSDFDVFLTVEGGGYTFGQVRRVRIIREERSYALAAMMSCAPGGIFSAAPEVAADHISREMRVTSVSAQVTSRGRADVPLTVNHAGGRGVFPPGSHDLTDRPLTTPWFLSAPRVMGDCAEGSTVDPGGLDALDASLFITARCGRPALANPSPLPMCGGEGQRCCAHNSCFGGGLCGYYLDGLCHAAGTSLPSANRCNGQPSTSQTATFTVPLRDRNGCSLTTQLRADSQEEADDCARSQFGWFTEVVPGNPELGCEDFCVDPNLDRGDDEETDSLTGFTAEDRLRCMQWTYPFASVTAGTCPGRPSACP